MSASMCPTCGAIGDRDCEWPKGDERECPFYRPEEPDPDHQREMRDEMRRLWPDHPEDDR